MKCSDKGCDAAAVARFIDPESADHPERPGTEYPVCWKGFWQRIEKEVKDEFLAKLRAKRKQP
jgi:hypothetical protein